MKAKILVVDDHEAARIGLSQVLVTHGFDVVGVAENGGQAVSTISSHPIDAIVMDVRMPQIDGLTALESIRSTKQNLPVIVVSAHENSTYVARAAALGAYDYVLKNGCSSNLCLSLQNAVAGQAPPDGSRMTAIRKRLGKVVDLKGPDGEFPLTGRESQVLAHVAFGLSNREISQSLTISVETVKEHVQNILRKLKAKDRTDAAVRAVKQGLVDRRKGVRYQ